MCVRVCVGRNVCICVWVCVCVCAKDKTESGRPQSVVFMEVMQNRSRTREGEEGREVKNDERNVRADLETDRQADRLGAQRQRT